MDQRHEWFREGARAFRAAQRLLGREHFLPSDEDLYACPLCLKYIFRIGAIETGDLTREHAPPESLGGKKLALTCRWCNNDSGKHFDAEAQKQERLRLFFAGESDQAMRGTFTIGGVTNRGEIHLAGTTGMLLVGVPQINNPAEVDRLERAMSATASAGSDFRINVTPNVRFSPDRARVSWVRSAYVVAFAVFGWRYTLQTSLNPVRAQFRNPTNVTLPEISLYEPEADPSRRELMVVEEPADCQSVVVRVGRHSVFLPGIDSTRSLADLAEALHSYNQPGGPARFSMSGTWVPWPAKPQYALDPVNP